MESAAAGAGAATGGGGIRVHADGRTITFSSRACSSALVVSTPSSPVPSPEERAHLVIIAVASLGPDQVAEAFLIAEDSSAQRAHDAVLLRPRVEDASERRLDVRDGRLASQLEHEQRRRRARGLRAEPHRDPHALAHRMCRSDQRSRERERDGDTSGEIRRSCADCKWT